MSDFGSPEHTLRSWIGNDLAMYREVERIAADTAHMGERADRLGAVVREVLWMPTGAARYRKLHDAAHTGQVFSWAVALSTLDGIRDSITREEFDRINWWTVTDDVMQTTDHLEVSA